MRLKSYFSGTVEAAMDLARKELGEDALLIHARPASRETRGLGAFEVVFGLPPDVELPPPPAQPIQETDAGLPAPRPEALPAPYVGYRDVKNELAGLRREIAQLTRGMEGLRSQADGAALADLFEVDTTLGRKGASRAMVALVGPPGAGKTTALIKLAARYGLAARKPVRILSADVQRIAAADQLRSLASILGIPCAIAHHPAVLGRALETQSPDELLFIDTPGIGPKDMDACAGWVRTLSSHAEIDVHLVLPCTMSSRDLRSASDRFAAFRPGKLLFTRVDEAGSWGALVNESARCELPISFLSTGQDIPNDLEPATKAGISALVYGTTVNENKSTGAAA